MNKSRRKVVVLGLGWGLDAAPFDDPSWEIWGLNGGHRNGRIAAALDAGRIARWFQIHPPDACDASEREWFAVEDAAIAAGRSPVPIYVLPADLDAWRAVAPLVDLRPYPVDAVRAAFPHGWFANTFCLEAALALVEGVTDVAFLGCECGGYGRELVVERAAVSRWIGYVEVLGRAHLHAETTLGYAPLYGVDYWDEARAAAAIVERILPLDQSEMAGELDGVNLDTVAAVDAAQQRKD